MLRSIRMLFALHSLTAFEPKSPICVALSKDLGEAESRDATAQIGSHRRDGAQRDHAGRRVTSTSHEARGTRIPGQTPTRSRCALPQTCGFSWPAGDWRRLPLGPCGSEGRAGDWRRPSFVHPRVLAARLDSRPIVVTDLVARRTVAGLKSSSPEPGSRWLGWAKTPSVVWSSSISPCFSSTLASIGHSGLWLWRLVVAAWFWSPP